MKTKTLIQKIKYVTVLQYLGEKNKYEVCEFFKGIKFNANFEKLPTLVITTDEGYYKINPTDWLIKKEDGDIEYLPDNKMSEHFEDADSYLTEKNKAQIANVRYTQEREKNKELIEVIDSFIRQDHNKGYPTGKEWNDLITEAKKFLSKYPESLNEK